MAEPREDHRHTEEFHEETPQEFAAQPDREFTKAPRPGAGSSPAGTDAEPDDEQADRASTDED
jgi:hypothetical protein